VQLDWFTVAAEIINFLILVVLLKHFLYDRIINMADAREAKVAARFVEAEEKIEKAHQEAEAYQAERRALQDGQEALMAQARAEVEARQKEWLDQAHCEIEQTKAEWFQAIHREQAAFMQALRQRIIQQTYALIRRALTDLADVELEQRLIDVFVKQIENLAADERQALAASIRDSGRDLVITSAFELSPEKRQRLLDAMRAQFGHRLDGHFKISPDLICGIEIKADSYKVAWSLDHYLTILEENLAGVLAETLSQESRPKDVTADER
jgi:F-type H+-transporting ATPase subunit b